MGDVIEGNFITRLDLPPERVIARAQDADLENVVVLGYTKDGDEYFASSISDGGTVNWLLDRAKMKLLAMLEEMGENDGGA